MKDAAFPSRHISIAINCNADDVYAFASNPANLPQWAAGVSGSVRKSGDNWISDSPMGEVQIRFADANSLGVLDHDVTLPSGETVYNPMRVFPNNQGSEVVFTLYRQPKMSDDDFEKDAQMIERDLQKLRSILEEKQK
ncbi:polyketide cyclase [Candidatus Peregrinibacteria bacterium CG10_big_fil_rev_8_21_14_0_10_49_24]|nr:MAG: polyketide cyclase [Candidatus Peregrinibacteria bacterium CG11_big_fil_rev_8_21_14_0_20_49_14]PIR51076.1 MAG: polyketide cyclase [Candidatus Peregrinibacteria bacterium CG10_big_fil_rev_8_21_14_0_10_49_24]PJA67629.1 MAG: polyketide cyclase [Candidatus Peregrinibacteria bacterium CG_4_9_14_3_um_filter_49_12]